MEFPFAFPIREAGPLSAIVAIPARNEAERIDKCLAALALQRDAFGAPIAKDAFEVILLANNCADDTVSVARALEPLLPYRLRVIEALLTPAAATAGGARRAVMDEAALRISKTGGDGIILTTDADSVVTPTWFANSIQHLHDGADCVAGTIDADSAEIIRLGRRFLERGRLEDTYLRLVAEIYARCDPRPHDPWPSHRVSSGASLAVKLSAYRAVGGLPPIALGEDIAFTKLLDRRGFKVRHALDVAVTTSCRLDGRAMGGAADTMRLRRDEPDAACDDDVETALRTWRRATMRGHLRHAFQTGQTIAAIQGLGLGMSLDPGEEPIFAEVWEQVERRHPRLARRASLRPSDLPRQIASAHLVLQQFGIGTSAPDAQVGRYPRAKSSVSVSQLRPSWRKGRSPDAPSVGSSFRQASGTE